MNQPNCMAGITKSYDSDIRIAEIESLKIRTASMIRHADKRVLKEISNTLRALLTMADNQRDEKDVAKSE